MRATAVTVFGAGKLIDPSKLLLVITSPRQRAKRTWDIFLEQGTHCDGCEKVQLQSRETEQICEWGYGEYEGKLTSEIRALRAGRGLNKERAWDIWRDGCEGGESPGQVVERLDVLIGEIVAAQRDAVGQRKDVVVVGHGHICRAFVKRWLRLPIETEVELMLEPGGVGGLSYAHGDFERRAMLVGMSYPAGEKR